MKSFFNKSDVDEIASIKIQFKYIIEPKLKAMNNPTIQNILNEIENIGFNFDYPKEFNYTNNSLGDKDYKLEFPFFKFKYNNKTYYTLSTSFKGNK